MYSIGAAPFCSSSLPFFRASETIPSLASTPTTFERKIYLISQSHSQSLGSSLRSRTPRPKLFPAEQHWHRIEKLFRPFRKYCAFEHGRVRVRCVGENGNFTLTSPPFVFVSSSFLCKVVKVVDKKDFFFFKGFDPREDDDYIFWLKRNYWLSTKKTKDGKRLLSSGGGLFRRILDEETTARRIDVM